MNQNRRDFLKKFAITTAGIGLSGGVFTRAQEVFANEKKAAAAGAKEIPLPAGEKMVNEADALPNALGYKHNVKDIDYKKYPKRKEKAKANEFCDNCALYTKSNEGWGKCTMLANAGVVAAKGWCGSWSKKA